MLAALAEAHPEKATMSHPNGTAAPRRLPQPGTASIQAIDYERG